MGISLFRYFSFRFFFSFFFVLFFGSVFVVFLFCFVCLLFLWLLLFPCYPPGTLLVSSGDGWAQPRRTCPCLRSLFKVAPDIVPKFYWLNTDRPRPQGRVVSFSHSSFLEAINVPLLWSVLAQKAAQASRYFCPPSCQPVPMSVVLAGRSRCLLLQTATWPRCV